MMPDARLLGSVETAFLQIKQLIESGASAIRVEQTAGLRDLLTQAKKLKFWNTRLGDLPAEIEIDDLHAEIQILTRREIQENSGFLRIRVPNTSKSDYFISSSSGSTGQPVEVMKLVPAERVKSAVISLLMNEWSGLDVSKNYAGVYAGKPESHSPSWGFPLNMISETGSRMVFDLNLRGIEGVVEALRENDVSYIHTNMTTLRALAFAMRELPKEMQPKLEKALNWAERVTEEDREFIRESLGIEIWDNYSAEELGAIALQCPKFTHLHTLPFFTHIEVVDDDGNPCEVGETGRVIATSLHNYAQPLIRYELGDLAKMEPACPEFPGLPVISPEVTRVRDKFLTKKGTTRFPRFGKCRFMHYKGLRDFQIGVFEDGIVFFHTANVALTEQQIVELQEDVGAQFDFDRPVFVIRLQDSEIFSSWKRKVFYMTKENLADLGLENHERLLAAFQQPV